MDAKIAKKETIDKLKQSGDWHRYNASNTWKDAFTAFQLDTGQSVGLRCSKCYEKVKKWLQN